MNSVKLSPQRVVSILRSSKRGLEFVTQNDWTLILDKSKLVSFEKGDAIISAGRRLSKVYMIVQGIGTVLDDGQEPISQVGPGEIVGEMAFLELKQASASVVANEHVETYAIDWPTLVELFDLYPHLASRVYRSIAMNLSNRLRDMIAKNQKIAK